MVFWLVVQTKRSKTKLRYNIWHSKMIALREPKTMPGGFCQIALNNFLEDKVGNQIYYQLTVILMTYDMYKYNVYGPSRKFVTMKSHTFDISNLK